MMAAATSEQPSIAAPLESSSSSSKTTDNNASAACQLPLKKTPSRPTAVSTVYELLTRPSPTTASSVNAMMMSSSMTSASSTTTKSSTNNHHHHLPNNNNRSSTSITSTSTTITAIKTLTNQTTSPTTSPTTNGYDSGYQPSYRQQKQMLTITNGHHYIQHLNSSPASLVINGSSSATNGVATGSTSSHSPTSSASSSSQHSPPESSNGTRQPLETAHPAPKRHFSMPYYYSSRDGDEDDRPAVTAGPMSSLLVIRDGDRPFDFYRAKFTMASPDEDRPMMKDEMADDDYPAEFVTTATMTSSYHRQSSWSPAIATPFLSLPVQQIHHHHQSESYVETSSGYSSNGHSPAPIRRRSTCLCSSLGIRCCDTPRSGPSSSPSFNKPAPGASPMRGPATAVRSPSAVSQTEQGSAPGAPAQRSASSIKDTLLKWTQQVTTGYDNVNVTNFSSSWSDGMAFCAIVHHYYPNAFDFSRLDPKRRKANFKLAFDLAEKLGDVPQLLEVEDMVRMKQPDWKCVFTYVQTMYRKLHDKQPTMLPPRKSSGDGSTTTQPSESTSSGVESISSGGGSPVKLSPMPHEDDDVSSPNNPFKAEFAKMVLK